MRHPLSPLLPFYPTGVKEDPGEGSRPRWKWTVILPFIDTYQVHQALGPMLEAPPSGEGGEGGLTREERERNTTGSELAFSAPRRLSWCIISDYYHIWTYVL